MVSPTSAVPSPCLFGCAMGCDNATGGVDADTAADRHQCFPAPQHLNADTNRVRGHNQHGAQTNVLVTTPTFPHFHGSSGIAGPHHNHRGQLSQPSPADNIHIETCCSNDLSCSNPRRHPQADQPPFASLGRASLAHHRRFSLDEEDATVTECSGRAFYRLERCHSSPEDFRRETRDINTAETLSEESGPTVASRQCMSYESLLDTQGICVGTRAGSPCQLDKFAPPGSVAPDMIHTDAEGRGTEMGAGVGYHRLARSTGDIDTLYSSISDGRLLAGRHVKSKAPKRQSTAGVLEQKKEFKPAESPRLQQTYTAVLAELSRKRSH